MPSLKVLAFDGIVPRLSSTLLADNQAQVANNVKLFSKEIRSWRGPLLAYTPALDNVHTIYRLYSASLDIWLTWTTEVDVAPGPIADTTEGRIYYTGDGTGPRKTNFALANTGGPPYPHAYQEMGVPAPSAKPTTSLTTPGTGTPETRSYVFTYVNDFGSVREEGPPSPPSDALSVPAVGSSVTINGFPALPAGAYNFTARRIYRTIPGATTASYAFVAEVPIATTSFVDNLAALSLGGSMTTLSFKPPPAELKGLIAIPGTGALAGFVGNTVYFSEPYFPHAWPPDYALSLPYNVVGLSSFGTTVVVLTDRFPYLLNGGTPGQMSQERLDLMEPCISKASIVTNEHGVIYASPNGLVALGPANEGIITRGGMTRDEWLKLQPAAMKAAIIDGRYLGAFQASESHALLVNGYDQPALTNIDVPASALYVDSQSTTVYYSSSADGKIYQLDADDEAPLPFEWLSKRFLVPKGTVFSIGAVDAAYEQMGDSTDYNARRDAIIAANIALFPNPLKGAINATPFNTFTLNGSILQEVPRPASGRYLNVIVIADGNVVASLNPTKLDPFRLPPFRAREIELRILGNIDVRSVQLASTIEELTSA